MKNFYVLSKAAVQIDKDQVMKLIQCGEDSPVYEEIQQEYRQLETEVKCRIHRRKLPAKGTEYR